jgi:hypothetical protein
MSGILFAIHKILDKKEKNNEPFLRRPKFPNNDS